MNEKTREEIDRLKADWVKDSCWDIEDTEGFEAHRDELVAFHLQKKAEWHRSHMTRLVEAIQHSDAEMRLFDEVGDRSGWGRTNIVAALGELMLKYKADVIAALNAYPG